MKAEEIKQNLNKTVIYRSARDGSEREYLFTGAIFRKDKKDYYYQAELQDPSQNRSILICGLDDIKGKDVIA